MPLPHTVKVTVSVTYPQGAEARQRGMDKDTEGVEGKESGKKGGEGKAKAAAKSRAKAKPKRSPQKKHSPRKLYCPKKARSPKSVERHTNLKSKIAELKAQGRPSNVAMAARALSFADHLD